MAIARVVTVAANINAARRSFSDSSTSKIPFDLSRLWRDTLTKTRIIADLRRNCPINTSIRQDLQDCSGLTCKSCKILEILSKLLSLELESIVVGCEFRPSGGSSRA